jgi:hypothetical protein
MASSEVIKLFGTMFTKAIYSFDSDSMQKMWDSTKAVQQNLADFGLAFDANKAIKTKSTKAEFIERAKRGGASTNAAASGHDQVGVHEQCGTEK